MFAIYVHKINHDIHIHKICNTNPSTQFKQKQQLDKTKTTNSFPYVILMTKGNLNL